MTDQKTEYPDGVCASDHVAHDMRTGRFPARSSVEEFVAERRQRLRGNTAMSDQLTLPDQVALLRTEIIRKMESGMVMLTMENCIASVVVELLERVEQELRHDS